MCMEGSGGTQAWQTLMSTRVVSGIACLGIYEAEMLGCILKDANEFMALQSAPDSSLIRHELCCHRLCLITEHHLHRDRVKD